MKINYKGLMVVNYIYLVVLELIFKLFIIKTIDNGIIYILIFSLPVAIILTFLMSLFKKKIVNKIFAIVIWLVLLFVFCAETVYYSFYSTICGLSALMYSGQVMEFYTAIITHIKDNIFVVIAYSIINLVLIVLTLSKVIINERFILKDTFLLIISTFLFGLTSLEYITNEGETAKILYYETNDIMQSTNKFGIITAVSLDVCKLMSKFEEKVVLVNDFTFTKDETIEYNETNIDFDSLINNESDSTIKTMHEYFSSQAPSNKNEYTGMFAGKNLIFITAEGFYPIAVNEELTPTLYKLTNNGFIFNNYYQPIYNCSTSDGEFINLLSILPGVATCSMKETSNTYLPYSIGNIFKDYNYSSYGFHGWTYSYYNRDKTYPNLGFDYYGYDRYKKGYKNALVGIKDSWPTSDIDVMNSSYNIYNSNTPFVSYYMSISGHLEYNFSGGNAIASKNKSLVSGLDASESIKAYIATQIEFDKSLEILINNLEKDGILDDTVIVIGADHYPYGLSNSEISNYVDWMKDANFDLYKNNLIIYNSEMENVSVDKYTSSLDVLPTVLNLFGIRYDSRLLIGRDIFSDSSDLVIFNNKSWITDKGRYNYLTKEFTSFTDNVDDDYVDSINEIVKAKFQMSKLIISKDYYRKVLGG